MVTATTVEMTVAAPNHYYLTTVNRQGLKTCCISGYKALHIVSVVCWFAGLFYLPRLFVYHADSKDQISRDRFVIMERKLYRFIMGRR